MRVDEGFDNSAAGVEQIGSRTAIAVVGVGRACDDGTEVRVFNVDVPVPSRPLRAALVIITVLPPHRVIGGRSN